MEMLMHAERPWYRQFWPWMLIALPASAVIAGFITLYIAINTTDSLVVDDYYKEGKAINLQLARDRRATALGLSATIATAPDGMTLALRASAPMHWPERLTLKFVHATRKPLDRQVEFRSLGSGHYVAEHASMPGSGRWVVHLESPDGDWRLVQELAATGATLTLRSGAAATDVEEPRR